MNRLIFAASLGLATLALAACRDDGAAPPALTREAIAKDWSLAAFNGGAALPRVTMDLREAGRAAGQAPCNRWFASVQGELPAFSFGGAGATRMACPDLVAEGQFLTALGQVTTAALEGDRLVLSGAENVRLEFLPKMP